MLSGQLDTAGLVAAKADMKILLLAGPRWKEPLSEQSPFANSPDREVTHRLPEEGDVIGHQEKAERQHPQSKDGQYREHSSKDKEDSYRHSDPLRLRVTKVAKNPSDLAGHLMFQMPERLPQNSSAGHILHAL
jgi:hypothetical protein